MEIPDRYVFEVKDWRGRTVRMTRKTYDIHVERHAEVPEYVQEAQLVVADPDAIYRADVGRSLHLYRFGLGRGRYANTNLVVVVHYTDDTDQATCLVATYYYRRRLPRLELVEERYHHLGGERITHEQYREHLSEEVRDLLQEERTLRGVDDDEEA